MRVRHLLTLGVAGALLSGTGAPPASAAGLSVAPTQVSLRPVAAPVNVQLRWSFDSGSGGSLKAYSAEGTLSLPSGFVLMVSSAAVGGPCQSPCTFVESLSIPAAVVRRALDRGAPFMRYRREFSIAGTTVTVTSAAARLVFQPGAPQYELEVSVRPRQATVFAAGPASQVLRWSVAASGEPPAGLEAFSPERVFLTPDGEELGREAVRLGGAVAPGGTLFPETVPFPQPLLRRAVELGAGRVLCRRVFEAEGKEAAAEFALDLAGRIGAGFALDRVELRFEGGGIFRYVPRGAGLRALAEIGFLGSGRATGAWEVEEPGAGGFRTLALFGEELLPGSGGTLLSPPLPTSRTGRHRVRLRLDSPVLALEGLPVEYEVAAGATARAPIEVRAPRDDERIGEGVRFAWEPVPRAAFYLVELFGHPPEPGAGTPIAGLALPGDRSEAALSRAAAMHLPPGASLWWRILALDAEGRVIGTSEVRVGRAP